MIDELKYPFGFLLTKREFNNRYGWEEYHIDEEWVLYYDTRNEFTHFESDSIEVTALGYFFDIRNGLLDRSSIAKKIITSKRMSYHNFLDELSYLNGRFLLILKHGNETLLYHDVAGLRAVCFHLNEPIIASHDTLINEVMNNKLRQIYLNPSEISFSDKTRFQDVHKLIPNMSLDINKRTIKRYYPLTNYEEKSKSEIKNELLFYFRETVKWLKSTDYKLLLSLTGGGDSRTSLAILKPIINGIEVFTYLKDTSNSNEFVKKTYKNDEQIVASIVKNLNLNHKFFYISSNDQTNEKVIETIKHNVFSSHSLNLANDYYNMYGNKKYLHIRSTALFNIGKYIYPKSSLKINSWQTKNIAKYLGKWTNISDEEERIDYIKGLITHAQLDNFYNYNPLELLFLSYRLIQWHSGVVGESDIGFNTMLLLNSRKIVDLMLSYPIEERAENKLFIDLIDELWPILNYWSINSMDTMADKYKKANEEVQKHKEVNKKLLHSLIDTKTTQSSSPECIPCEKGYYYKFKKQISKNDYYIVRIKLSKLDTDLSLRFKIIFLNNDPNKKDRIIVTSNLFKEDKDIIDLYGEKEFVIKGYELNRDIYLKVQHLYADDSAEDSKVWIGDFELYDGE